MKELVFPKALDLDRPKRARTTFSPEQLNELEQEFQRNQYLVGKERTELSRRLKLSETQVYVDYIFFKHLFLYYSTIYKIYKPSLGAIE